MDNYNKVSAIILSGGKSSRLGEDKCDLIFNGTSFLNNQVKKMASIGIVDILASGYHGNNSEAKVIEDSILKGPLSGLYFGLKNIVNDRAFVVSVDVPLISTETIKKIIDYSFEIDKDIVVVKHGKDIEPLIAVYKKELYTIIYEMLKGDDYSVRSLFDKCKVSYIEIDNTDELVNINYKDDYLQLIKEHK